MMKVISVVGARPNFMKIAPIHFAWQQYRDKVTHLICHTGQHYDEKMSKVFFDELGLPKPDYYLGVGSGSHAVQTAQVMVEFEKVLLQENPDLVIVVGDVNSTIACTLVAKKMQIKVAHVEAGLRSFDRSMPEEINRILTDAIADYLFVSEQSGITNLAHEGISDNKVFLVGNVMIDSLVSNFLKIEQSDILAAFDLQASKYILTTLHRPNNVDREDSLRSIIGILNKYSKEYKVVFPVHPRTKSNLETFQLAGHISDNIILCDPIGYSDFIWLVKNAMLILTDSGGIQEESSFLQVPCITLRENTERPVTMELGTNQLIGTDLKKIDKAIEEVLAGKPVHRRTIPFWDGKAAERICRILVEKAFS